MAFKRYENFVAGKTQKRIDNELKKCPFCEEDPHWLLDLTNGLTSIKIICMCEKCKAKLFYECPGMLSFKENMTVIDVGDKNIHNLSLNAIYNVYALKSLTNPSTPEEVKIEPQIESKATDTDSINNHKKGIIWGIITASVLFIAMFIWLIMPVFGLTDPGPSDLVAVEQSNMEVQELAGAYYVTITGSAKNTSNQTMDYVSITFTIYDAFGNVIGTAMDNQTNLGAGETWLYSAVGFTTTARPVTWKSSDVTVLCD